MFIILILVTCGLDQGNVMRNLSMGKSFNSEIIPDILRHHPMVIKSTSEYKATNNKHFAICDANAESSIKAGSTTAFSSRQRTNDDTALYPLKPELCAEVVDDV